MAKRASKRSMDPVKKAIMISMLTGVVCLVGIASLGALLVLREVLPESAQAYVAIAAVLLAVLIGSIPLVKAIGKKRLLMAYAYGACTLLVLFVLRLMFWGGEPFNGLPVIAAAAVGSTISGFLCSRQTKRRR